MNKVIVVLVAVVLCVNLLTACTYGASEETIPQNSNTESPSIPKTSTEPMTETTIETYPEITVTETTVSTVEETAAPTTEPSYQAPTAAPTTEPVKTEPVETAAPTESPEADMSNMTDEF